MMRHLLAIMTVAVAAASMPSPALIIAASTPRLYARSMIDAAAKSYSGVAVSKDKKTLTISSMAARLVVTTGPDNDMLSYRIMGLRNPTIYVKAGATVSILFVNTDSDMLHNLRVTGNKAPFAAKFAGATTGSVDLPHANGAAFTGQTITFKVPSQKGSYSYLCTIMGHAAAGMYGTIIVR